jgi:hypothetical protein
MMWRRLLPAAFGSSSAIRQWTLVANTIFARLPFAFRAAPVTTSDRPQPYALAVSKKFIPVSIDRSMMEHASLGSVVDPKGKHPRQISLTCTVVRPNE